MDKAKQFTWRLLAASVCLLTVSQVARADSLDEQRNRYAQIKQAWDNRQMDVVEQMMPGLKNYPLYPYLEYRQITDDLMNQPTITVTNFVRANPTLPPARTLQSRFVNELARREDWRGLLAFSPEKPGTTEAQCNYYYAKWNTGQAEEAWNGAKELWLSGKSQPNACDSLFGAWRASGKQDPLAYLERIRLAMKAGNTGLVSVLAQRLLRRVCPHCAVDVRPTPVHLQRLRATVAGDDVHAGIGRGGCGVRTWTCRTTPAVATAKPSARS